MAVRVPDAGRDLVVVGTVVKPHGIKGEICVISHADSPSLFSEVPHVYLRGKKGNMQSYELTKLRMHKSRPLLTLKGVTDRNQVELLRGMEIVVKREDMPAPEDDQVYLHDIIGFMVTLEDGTEIGPFIRFIETSATEVWIVKHPVTEIMIPAEDEFIIDIDMDAKRIIVDPPEGLIELYLAEEAKPKKKKKHRRPFQRRRPSKKGKTKATGE